MLPHVDRQGDLPGVPLTEEEVFELGLVDPGWGGNALGLDIGAWRALGPVNWTSGVDVEDNWATRIATASGVVEGVSPSSDVPSGAFYVLDVPEGEAYYVEMDAAAIETLGQALASAEAAAEASSEPAFPEGPGGESPIAATTPLGLLGAPPSAAAMRSILPAGRFKDVPWNSMGTSGICTGTMIGSSTLVTAGHCIVDYGESNHQSWYTGNDVWDIAINRADNAPDQCFLPADADKMFVRARLVDPGHNIYWYYAYDYAVVALREPPEQPVPPTPGCPATAPWMTKEVLPNTPLFEGVFRHDGYPSCNDEEAPPGCGTKYHYETLPVDVGVDWLTIIFEDAAGLDTTVAHDGITSPGHSGGPYWYVNSKGRARMVGTEVGGNTNGLMDGILRRFTETSINQINTWVCLAVPCI